MWDSRRIIPKVSIHFIGIVHNTVMLHFLLATAYPESIKYFFKNPAAVPGLTCIMAAPKGLLILQGGSGLSGPPGLGFALAGFELLWPLTGGSVTELLPPL